MEFFTKDDPSVKLFMKASRETLVIIAKTHNLKITKSMKKLEIAILLVKDENKRFFENWNKITDF